MFLAQFFLQLQLVCSQNTFASTNFPDFVMCSKPRCTLNFCWCILLRSMFLVRFRLLILLGTWSTFDCPCTEDIVNVTIWMECCKNVTEIYRSQPTRSKIRMKWKLSHTSVCDLCWVYFHTQIHCHSKYIWSCIYGAHYRRTLSFFSSPYESLPYSLPLPFTFSRSRTRALIRTLTHFFFTFFSVLVYSSVSKQQNNKFMIIFHNFASNILLLLRKF